MLSSICVLILFISTDYRPHGPGETLAASSLLPRSPSTAEFQPMEDREVEYFFASDASAVIEHTNRVIFLEVSTPSSQLLSGLYVICSIVMQVLTSSNQIGFVCRMMTLLL